MLRRAFTIMEVLVVVAIVVILTIVAVPAFRAMIESSEETMAESMLRAAVRAGRDAALRSGEGADGAAVFFFEPGGRTSIVPYVKVASFNEVVPGTPPMSVPREVFVPAPQGQPVQLPRGWMVRGYARMGAIETDVNGEGEGWYNAKANATSGADVVARYDHRADNWVFPETGFYDSSRDDEGIRRSTFMLRFRGGTGEFVSAPAAPVLLFAPNSDARGLNALLAPSSPISTPLAELRRIDPVRYVRAVLSGTVGGPSGSARALTQVERRALVGRISSDMVLAGPVTQITLYQERELAAALGLRVNDVSGCLYQPVKISADPTSGPLPHSPTLIDENPPGGSKFWTRVQLWVEGDTNGDRIYFDSDASRRDTVTAKLFALDRYSGTLRQLDVGPLSQ